MSRTVSVFQRIKDFKPFRVRLFSQFAVIDAWPFQFWAHLHVHPNEHTDKAAFTIKTSVSLVVKRFDRDIYKRTILEHEQHWGLCARMLFTEKK